VAKKDDLIRVNPSVDSIFEITNTLFHEAITTLYLFRLL
jgi:hypothetical protein